MSTNSEVNLNNAIAGVPAVRLKTLMPRRVYVPLEIVRGKNAKDLCKRILDGERFAVYWLHSYESEDGKITESWKCASSLVDNRLPSSLWLDSCSEWEIPPDSHSDPVEVDHPTDALLPIEISIVVAGEGNDECGLSIAWNPVLEDTKRTCLLVTEKSPDVTSTGFLQNQRLIHLLAKKIAILPIKDSEAPKSPPDMSDFVSGLTNLVGVRDHRWQLRPKPTCFYVQGANRQSQDAAVLSVDFGTSSSTVSILNVKRSDRESLGNVGMINDLCPWTHATVFPNHAIETSPGHIAAETKVFRKAELWRGTVPIAPPHVADHRLQWSRQCTARVSSLLYALDDHADEIVTTHKEDAIGNEADEAFDENLRSKTRKAWRQFRFSPKKQLGSTKGNLDTRLNEHPIELYLRELFDQAMHTRLLESPQSVMVPIDKVAYSYPVTWTRDQRKQYRHHLERAIERSFISELTEFGRGHSIFDDSYAMDEASAAFLGFLLERFKGLQGNEVVDIFQPFDPSPDSQSEYPKSINALIFDCGEGTTDLVLLKITDSGQVTKPVDSKVVHHFAMEKAGLEVTRRIAERLKEYLKIANPENEHELRTNLHDLGLDEYQTALQTNTQRQERPQDKETYRRTLIYAIMKEAERVKLELTKGSAQINWSEIIRLTGLATPAEKEIEQEELVKIVSEVFSPTVTMIQRWLAGGISLNAILMSGRSSQLPGLKELIGDNLPADQRPFEIDFVRPGSFKLKPDEDGCDESSKTAVCKGLAMNFWNLSGYNTRALKCHPIDEKLRARAIGILEMDVALNPLPSFDERYQLLVDSDNNPVKPENDLPPLISHNPTSRGFYLGINFAGRASQTKAFGEADSPQPFCHVLIENGREGAYRELRFVFRQVSATEVRLAHVELEGDDGYTVRKDVAIKDELKTTVEIGSLRITLAPYRVDEDARVTGRIHIDGAKPLDHDR